MSMTNTEAFESSLASALFASMAHAMLLCDEGLTIVAGNQAAAGLLGAPPGQFAGKKAHEVLPPWPEDETNLPAASAGRLEWRCRLDRPGADCRHLEVSGVFLDRESDIRGWALTLNDCGAASEPPEFIGSSAAAKELLEFVWRIAASRVKSILLCGESGTGKELIAKRLHCLSARSGAAFVPVNCAALPETLLENELFGHERGAFTDARETRQGLLEVAHGGTLFLDEIGELSLPLQAKLLRVLEDHTFRRVGGSRNISVDLRVVGATNGDLQLALEERRFRSDLYYRLNAVQIRLPNLRERPEDIRDLARHFLGQFNRLHHRRVRGFHPAAQRILELHSWPGNVRELRNVVERAVLVEASPWITAQSLSISNRSAGVTFRSSHLELPACSAPLSLRSSERELIAAALAEANGNQTRAAGLLGIGRFGLRYKMKKSGLL